MKFPQYLTLVLFYMVEMHRTDVWWPDHDLTADMPNAISVNDAVDAYGRPIIYATVIKENYFVLFYM